MMRRYHITARAGASEPRWILTLAASRRPLPTNPVAKFFHSTPNAHCLRLTPSSLARTRRVYEIPPNGQGVTALLALNMLRHVPGLDSMEHNSTQYLHTLIEVLRWGGRRGDGQRGG
jgi:hypothetical protein